MEIWIIREGEKIGPYHDFEIRRKITTGEVLATTPAWHQGLSAWKPLVEIDLFSREFEQSPVPVENAETFEPPLPPRIGAKPPPLPKQQVFGRRFWARWLDLSFYSGFWWLGMWAAGQDIGAALENPWILFFHYVPWFALEAVLIQHFATTPGKWLLGLSVVNLDGSHLTLNESMLRCMKVLFSGIGFGFSYLAFFCQLISLVVAKRIGSTLWDQTGGHEVIARHLQPLRLIATVFAFVVAMMMQLSVALPYIAKEYEEENPEMKGYFDESLRWSLPKRH